MKGRKDKEATRPQGVELEKAEKSIRCGRSGERRDRQEQGGKEGAGGGSMGR